MDHIHKRIEWDAGKITQLETKLADALIINIQYKQENSSLKHVNQGLYNMIEGLQQQAKRLLGVNAEYKRQAKGGEGERKRGERSRVGAVKPLILQKVRDRVFKRVLYCGTRMETKKR